MFEVVVLLVLFQLKHFVADYPLQNSYMLGKFKESGWVAPLSAHCLVHAAVTFAICLSYGLTVAVLAACFDFIVHFAMDRVKASPKLLGRYKQDNPKFWWALGFDQMIHHLTHYTIIVVVVSGLLL